VKDDDVVDEMSQEVDGSDVIKNAVYRQRRTL